VESLAVTVSGFEFLRIVISLYGLLRVRAGRSQTQQDIKYTESMPTTTKRQRAEKERIKRRMCEALDRYNSYGTILLFLLLAATVASTTPNAPDSFLSTVSNLAQIGCGLLIARRVERDSQSRESIVSLHVVMTGGDSLSGIDEADDENDETDDAHV
jgi:hypothetical protein